MKNCVAKICELASENYGNQMITMPVIGSLLTLRDKNLSATMDSLAKIETQILHKIELLAKEHAPDLDQNIKDHVV